MKGDLKEDEEVAGAEEEADCKVEMKGDWTENGEDEVEDEEIALIESSVFFSQLLSSSSLNFSLSLFLLPSSPSSFSSHLSADSADSADSTG
ncbi:uncharacterized protein MONOS_13837 [Monocercomonoides exilis]|uniref:uncharacterized protein n=1 Tax=Monocercomonoides exilis TaxID=2049356 RepID=UPI0035598053|nr:hypothetical protein MONOS_13837 [Monocercomonoides exilis]|eukprot:MONOS_13837.1-p1 / transcript=MONOS_13837.1 / gene=MONOS_13837 / organism=Monocercomonoides_exilis_PA203 / gene_product=unspecified product / transcript_product=unspecified product / location=Mono_scaffold00891:11560-11835(+) / protein_length=92 / sequence_SO=supercontig / SO=protein_coding / is_pseudo=false